MKDLIKIILILTTMSQELTISLPQAMTSLEAFETTINIFVEESPEKAYLIANQMAKVSKKLQDNAKEWFQKYYDANKELPGGFECRVSEKKTYDYSGNKEWLKAKSLLDEIESKLKNATEQGMKWNMMMDDQGNIIEPVQIKFSQVYTVSRRK